MTGPSQTQGATIPAASPCPKSVVRRPYARAMDFGKLFGGIDAGDLAQVVQVVIDNKDVIDNLHRLPELFGKIAASLDGAGQEAKAAASALVGPDGSSGARGALASASTALAGIAASLGKGIDLVDAAATSAHKVPLMDGPADSLAGAASSLRDSTNLLGELASSMTGIAEVLAQVGAALDKVGDHLSDTGSQAHGFRAVPGSAPS